MFDREQQQEKFSGQANSDRWEYFERFLSLIEERQETADRPEFAQVPVTPEAI